MNKTKVAGLIDHTLLTPGVTYDDVKRLCNEAIEYGFASVCVNSVWVEAAYRLLKRSNVKVCSVVGFPLGSMKAEAKTFEAVRAVMDGAEEIDMVVDLSAVKNHMWDYVTEDIRMLVEAVKRIDKSIIVKVIIETCLLTDDEKVEAVVAARNAGAAFTKTSTGFSTGGATVHDVKLMIENGHIPVKASGGVRSLADVETMVSAGATRIGTSNGVHIMEEFEGIENQGDAVY